MMAEYQVHIAKPIEVQELLATVGSLAGPGLPTSPCSQARELFLDSTQ